MRTEAQLIEAFHLLFLRVLGGASGIELAEVSLVAQTETTLRCKAGLAAEGHRDLVRTKVEFPGRGSHGGGAGFDVVPDAIVMPCAPQALPVFHHLETPAIDGKVAAPAMRGGTWARDVFDLELLLRQRAARGARPTGLDSTDASVAAERALQIRYSSFTTTSRRSSTPRSTARRSGTTCT